MLHIGKGFEERNSHIPHAIIVVVSDLYPGVRPDLLLEEHRNQMLLKTQ